MTTKDRTLIFNVCVAIFNITLGLLIEGTLLISLMIFLSRYPQFGSGILGNVLLPFALFAGVIIAMLISTKVIAWVIRKLNLQDKVDHKAIKRYLHNDL